MGAEFESLSGSWVAVPPCAFASGAFALAQEDMPQKILTASYAGYECFTFNKLQV
jgi:hypothetical protein